MKTHHLQINEVNGRQWPEITCGANYQHPGKKLMATDKMDQVTCERCIMALKKAAKEAREHGSATFR
jgi:hypothetical protein